MECLGASPATSPPYVFPSQLCILGAYVLSRMKILLHVADPREFGIQHRQRESVREVYTQ